MPLRFSDAATSTISLSITTTTTSIVLESVASFPQGMIAEDFFIAVIANTENTVRETIKVTAINYTTKTLTVIRGYDSTTPIAWPLGSKVEIRGGSALFKEIIDSITSPLKTMSTQAANAVAITGGTVSGITGSINSVTPGSNSIGVRTVSTGNPTGGNDGDIWYKV
jgi:hypothetical protein